MPASGEPAASCRNLLRPEGLCRVLIALRVGPAGRTRPALCAAQCGVHRPARSVARCARVSGLAGGTSKALRAGLTRIEARGAHRYGKLAALAPQVAAHPGELQRQGRRRAHRLTHHRSPPPDRAAPRSIPSTAAWGSGHTDRGTGSVDRGGASSGALPGKCHRAPTALSGVAAAQLNFSQARPVYKSPPRCGFTLELQTALHASAVSKPRGASSVSEDVLKRPLRVAPQLIERLARRLGPGFIDRPLE